ncbi:MAG: YidC/Oxa1 family membrane protein insertase [Acidimicrobiales bacterium]
MFSAPAWLVDTFYSWTHNYAVSLGLVAVAVMLLITPLTMKSTKGMLEMQQLQPEMRRLQNQYRGDRQRLNEEMMKLYQEHKINPLAACLPLLAQMPVFLIMFQVIHGLTREPVPGKGFEPKYLSTTSDLYLSLKGKTEMRAFGLDLAISPLEAIQNSFVKGLPYAFIIVVLCGLFFVQQKMVANRATNASMSPGQAKVMQYLPVAFAVFQVLLLTGLVIYYLVQAIVRIIQQWYITRRFYGEGGLGQKAQEASRKAREMGDEPAKQSKQRDEQPHTPIQSRRVAQSKDRPTPSGRPNRPVPPSKRKK